MDFSFWPLGLINIFLPVHWSSKDIFPDTYINHIIQDRQTDWKVPYVKNINKNININKCLGLQLLTLSNLQIVESVEVNVEVCPDAVHRSWQSYASDEQHKQDNVGHSSCDVHNLRKHRRNRIKYITLTFTSILLKKKKNKQKQAVVEGAPSAFFLQFEH